MVLYVADQWMANHRCLEPGHAHPEWHHSDRATLTAAGGQLGLEIFWSRRCVELLVEGLPAGSEPRTTRRAVATRLGGLQAYRVKPLPDLGHAHEPDPVVLEGSRGRLWRRRADPRPAEAQVGGFTTSGQTATTTDFA